MKPLREIQTYGPEDWTQDRRHVTGGGVPACPNCGRAERYEIADRLVNGEPQRYRGCKACGFWQLADGASAPLRRHPVLHICLASLVEGERCALCETAGPCRWHECVAYLSEEDLAAGSIRCARCRTQLRWQHVAAWPTQAE